MSTSSEKRFSIEYMRECFDYRDGVLYWKERPARHFKNAAIHTTFIKKSAGKIAGRSETKGYLTVKLRIDGKSVCITVHRIVWALHHGKWPEHTVDHINRNRKDNRIENLRDVPMSVNLMNKGNPNSTGISGVHRAQGGKFTAQLRIGEKYVHLGTFDNPTDALTARIVAEGLALQAVQKPQLAKVVPLRVVEMAA